MTWSTFETYCATKGVANKATLTDLARREVLDVLVEIIFLSLRSAAGRAANKRMCVAHVLAKLSREKSCAATGSSGGCTMREADSRTSRPIMAMLGRIPVTECGVIRYATNSAGSRYGHDSGCASIEARSI